MNIFLCGMMGSGKTTLGELLAERLQRPFWDLDQELDRTLGYSFHRLVEQQGWLAFRELEYRVCADLARQDGAVIALGGGTVRYAWNRDLLRGRGLLILLEAPLEVLVQRVKKAPRPRVNAGTTVEDDLRHICQEAEQLYADVANHRLRTDQGTMQQQLARLERTVRKHALL